MNLTLPGKKEGFLSGNQLKILAALFMICDHVGMLFFPEIIPPMIFLRYIGRLAFPIFAFFIAEGCRYTKNKRRYLGVLAALGLVFHLVYCWATKDDTVNVIVSFALAVTFVYFWRFFIGAVQEKKHRQAVIFFVFWAIYGYFCFLLCRTVHVDYNFWGILLPWFVYLSGKKWIRLCLFGAGICLVAIGMGENVSVEAWALFAVPIMALYNGRRGSWRMKNFFYLFYPLHLVALYGIYLLTYGGIR